MWTPKCVNIRVCVYVYVFVSLFLCRAFKYNFSKMCNKCGMTELQQVKWSCILESLVSVLIILESQLLNIFI